MININRIAIACALTVLTTFNVHAQTAEGLKFFETKIRPVLVAHCYECHSTKSGKARGGLKLDSRDSLLKGGETGPAIVPKSLTKSLLFQSIQYGDEAYQMPPKGKLPDAVIADFRQWILMGAPDPRTTKINPAVKTEIDIEKGREYWAYQTPRTPAIPAATDNDWARTPIDRFVMAELKQHNLQPVEDATAGTLVRRLYFTITGLPPAPDEARTWTQKIEQQSTPEAKQQIIASLVDQLLNSPRYGERWGRHWMDVARFAESTGGDQNNVYQHAWRYRDYVIDAFNNDKPYDQFVREQIAGDLLPIADDQEWADNVIATGFLAMGVKLVGEEDQQKFFADLVDEQIDTTTRAFLATTVACARCHDHKFDPIPQADYYALAGIFRSTATHYGLLKAQARQATTLLDLTGMGPPPGTPPLDKNELAALIKERDDAAKAVSDAMTKIRGGENVFRGMLRRLRSQRDETEAALQAYSQKGEPRVFAMGTQDRDFPLATRLLLRGELDKPAQEVPRGMLQVLSPTGRHALPPRTKGSGRLELAEWMASDKNPLTARVMANRVWHWMVGRGLVRTVDDFGHSGDKPTHPELLDYLAVRLVENGWSVKALVREIALSRTWQLSSKYHKEHYAIDPDNKFLWRMNSRRLEAEAVRDAMLAVSGELDLQRPTGTYLREVGEGGVGQNVFEPVIRKIDANTRSVYLPRIRSVLPEMLEAFDAPDASLVTGARESTSSPLQALFLMNNPFVSRQAAALARRVEKLPADQRIDALYQLIYSRPPTTREKVLGLSYLGGATNTNTGGAEPATGPRGFRGRGRFSGRGTTANTPSAEESDSDAPVSLNDLAAYCQALLCTTEFQTID